MDVSAIPGILIGVAIVALVLVLALALRARARPREIGGGSAYRPPGRSAHAVGDFRAAMPGAAGLSSSDYSPEERVRQLAATGQKIEAIKLVRSTLGWDLKRAKQYVDSLATGPAMPARGAVPAEIDPELQRHLMALLQQGKPLEALKVARQHTGLDLKRIKALIDSLGRR